MLPIGTKISQYIVDFCMKYNIDQQEMIKVGHKIINP